MTGVWLVSYIVLWVLLLLIALVLVSILRNMGTLFDTLQKWQPMGEPPVNLVAGEPVTDIQLHTLSGEERTISTFQGVPTTIAIISPGCGPCRELMQTVARGEPMLPTAQAAQQIIVSTGSVTETATLVQQTALPSTVPVLIDHQQALSNQWGISSTPTIVQLDERMYFVDHTVGWSVSHTDSPPPVVSKF